MNSTPDEVPLPLRTELKGVLAHRGPVIGRRLKVLGVMAMVLGLAAISAPLIAGQFIVTTVGVLIIAGGILRIMWGIGAGTLGKAAFMVATGGLMLLCGLGLVIEPVFAFGFLTVLLAVYLLADGLTELIWAFRLRPETGRWWLLLGGIASILLGILIWRQFPLAGGWAIGVLLGLKLVLSGIVMVAVGRQIHL
jgi:uncharacterized membrane protein HdeD (DUF308 family)